MLFEENIGKKDMNEQRTTSGAHLGKGINKRHLTQLNNYLSPWLEKDEKIIAVFKTNGLRTLMDGLILSSQRVLTVDKMSLNSLKMKFVDEIAADDLLKFVGEKGLGKIVKMYAEKENGDKVYVGMASAETSTLNSFLPKMHGTPQAILAKIEIAKKQAADENAQKRAEEKQKRKLQATQEREANKNAKREQRLQKAKDREAEQQANKKEKKILGIFTDKKAQRNAAIEEMRRSLHDDWRTITATIIKSLKQHWNTLEVKFEQHIEQDDYGNQYIDSNFGSEIIYFSHKVVSPKIHKLISDGRIKDFSFDSIPAPSLVQENLYGIKFNDEENTIASKYVSGLIADGRPGLLNDELLYALRNVDGLGFVSIENESNDPSDKANLLALSFEGVLQPNKPIRVTAISGIVFILFYAMYSNRPEPGKSAQPALQADFIGNDPYKYEEYVKEMLRNRGFQTRKTRSSGDFGVDVLASKNGKSYALQCKLYNRPVGTKAIQEIVSGRLHYRADYALVVSDNKFTEAAKSLARSTSVILTHHNNLLRSIESLEGSQNQTHTVIESENEYADVVNQKLTTEKKWTKADADELVTVILPTINND